LPPTIQAGDGEFLKPCKRISFACFNIWQNLQKIDSVLGFLWEIIKFKIRITNIFQIIQMSLASFDNFLTSFDIAVDHIERIIKSSIFVLLINFQIIVSYFDYLLSFLNTERLSKSSFEYVACLLYQIQHQPPRCYLQAALRHS